MARMTFWCARTVDDRKAGVDVVSFEVSLAGGYSAQSYHSYLCAILETIPGDFPLLVPDAMGTIQRVQRRSIHAFATSSK